MLLKNFLTDEEIGRLLEIGKNEFSISAAYGNHRRASKTYWMNRTSEHQDPILRSLVKRIHQLAMIPVDYGEPLQLAKYAVDDKYEFHHDTDRRMARIATFLGYVNSPESGGWTIFPLVNGTNTKNTNLSPALDPFKLDLGVRDMQEYCETDQFLRVKPERGDSLLFFSMLPNLLIDEMAWHGSCPIISGEKLIVQRWIKYNPDPNYYSYRNAEA
jgi:prolyl 4-hydroxylase